MPEAGSAFGPEHLEKMKPGIACFNLQQYWECHEELEHVWLEDRNDPVRNVYWAVIQVAASMIHYREKNLVGASGMINKAKEKFRRVRDFHIYTPFLEEKLDWTRLETMTMAVPDKVQELAPFAPLFDFRFKEDL